VNMGVRRDNCPISSVENLKHMRPDVKTCHKCGEEIKSVAKKCPHCQSWQKGLGATLSNPAAAFAPALAILPILFLFYYYTGIFRGRGNEFEKYRQMVTVKESRLYYAKEDRTAYVSVIGALKNESDKKWKRVSFEVQYFDQSGALVDAQAHTIYDMVLLSHSEQAFRIRQEADKPEAAYQSHKVFIRDAELSDSWP
jgi:hypothetical protein